MKSKTNSSNGWPNCPPKNSGRPRPEGVVTMSDKTKEKKNKKKGWFAGVLDKLDKKMEEKAKKSPCCGGDSKGSSCC